MNKTIACILISLFWFQAGAHHSTNANFTQEIIAVEGVIEQVRYVNPHASVLIKNTAPDGSETYWLLETVGRTTLDRAGVNLQALEIGKQVTASGRKGRREFTMYLQKLTFEDGSEFSPEAD
ncbi:MAG: DUF6152 family protein [Gammaproteobacteria bacterium]